MPVRASPPDEQLRLDGAGPVDDHHAPGFVGGHRGQQQRPGAVAGPAAERAGEYRIQVHARQVAHDHRGRPGRPDLSLVERAHARRVDLCDSVLGALAWPGQPGGRREQLRRQLLGRPLAGVGHLDRDRIETVAHQTLDLAVGEGGPVQRLGQQLERLGQAGDWHLQRQARALVAGACVERRAAALQCGCEFLGGVCRRALRQRPDHDRGDTVEPGGLGVERDVQADLYRHHLLAGPVAAQYGQPIGEDAALGHGERPGLGRPGGRLRIEVHGHRCIGHRPAPSCSLPSPLVWPAAVSAASLEVTGS